MGLLQLVLRGVTIHLRVEGGGWRGDWLRTGDLEVSEYLQEEGPEQTALMLWLVQVSATFPSTSLTPGATGTYTALQALMGFI